jgi:hypothetical protein
MTPSLQTTVAAPGGSFDCIACGSEIRRTLAVLGSLRCHDCRDEGPGFVGHVATSPQRGRAGMAREEVAKP